MESFQDSPGGAGGNLRRSITSRSPSGAVCRRAGGEALVSSWAGASPARCDQSELKFHRHLPDPIPQMGGYPCRRITGKTFERSEAFMK